MAGALHDRFPAVCEAGRSEVHLDIITVDENGAGKRLDVFVAEQEAITRSAAQKRIGDGDVLVNGRQADKNDRLRNGDRVEISMPVLQPLDVAPEEIPLSIIYEDRDLIVVNKPKGMVVHPAPGNYTGTLVNALLWHCGSSLSGINGVIRPGIVHRIDKDTSGLLVVAKNDAAHESLAAQIASHRFERKYHAIVCGNLRNDGGTIDKPVGRHPVDRKKMAIVPDGRHAVTHFQVLERLKGATYLALQLETGRTHQIRVHMASCGHPLLGDIVYGGGKTKEEQRLREVLCGQCLHAKSISFLHPSTGELMRFESDLPDWFQTVLSYYRRLT